MVDKIGPYPFLIVQMESDLSELSELSDQFPRSDQIPTKLRDSELSDSEFSRTGLGLEFEKSAGVPAKLLILQSELSPTKFLVFRLGQLGIRSDRTRNRWGSVMCSSLPSSTSSSDTDNVSGTSMNPTCLFECLLEGLSEGDSDSELVFCGGAFFLLFCLAVVVSAPLSSLSLSLLLTPLSRCRRFLIRLDRREGGGFTSDLFFDIVGFFVMMGGMAVPHGWGSFILSAHSTCFMDMWLVIG